MSQVGTGADRVVRPCGVRFAASRRARRGRRALRCVKYRQLAWTMLEMVYAGKRGGTLLSYVGTANTQKRPTVLPGITVFKRFSCDLTVIQQ